MKLLELDNPDEYLEVFEKEFIHKRLYTIDGSEVVFRISRFKHDFYKCSGNKCFNHRHNWNCDKEVFDRERAERMLWIRKIVSGEWESEVRWEMDQFYRKEKRYYIFYDNSGDPYVVVLQKIKEGRFLFLTAFCPKEDWFERIERRTKKIRLFTKHNK